MYHPPMCLNCNVREVRGEFSDGNGDGFCSRFCRDEAHTQDEWATDADEPEWEEGYDEPREDQFRDDVEADADTLASAGWGTDEDYGYYGDGEY